MANVQTSVAQQAINNAMTRSGNYTFANGSTYNTPTTMPATSSNSSGGYGSSSYGPSQPSSGGSSGIPGFGSTPTTSGLLSNLSGIRNTGMSGSTPSYYSGAGSTAPGASTSGGYTSSPGLGTNMNSQGGSGTGAYGPNYNAQNQQVAGVGNAGILKNYMYGSSGSSSSSSGGSQQNGGASGSWDAPSGGQSYYQAPAYGVGGTKTAASMLNPTGTQQDEQLQTQDQAQPFGYKPVVDPNQANPNASRYDQSINQQNGLLSQFLADYKNKIDQGDQGVNQANQEMADFQKNNANQMSQIQGDNNLSVDTQSGKGQVISDRFAKEMPAYQGKVSTALSQRQQNIDAYNAMMGQMAPRQQGYVMIDPTTGQPVSGGSMGSAAFNGGQTNAREGQGGTYIQNQATLSTAGQIAQSIPSLIQRSGANPTDVNVLNDVINAFTTNASGKYPEVQSAFRNAIAQYAGILGEQKVNSLVEGAKGTTMTSFLQNLDSQARAVQNGLQNPNGGTPQTSQSSSSSGNSMFGSFF